MKSRLFRTTSILLAMAAAGFAALPAHAVMPVVKTVPWVATNPLIPHDTYAGKSVRLKGTSSHQGANFSYSWDFGDGSPPATGTVTNRYAIEASHTYVGAVGTIWTARLTVTDTSTGESASQTYFVKMEDKTLQAEVNVAIDEGLWYLHKTMTRDLSSGACGPGAGCWNSGNAGSSWYSNTSANVNAFFVNGHLETGAATNPYTETAQRAMRYVLGTLASSAVPSSQTNGMGSFNPDVNGNALGVHVNQADHFYQGGIIIDAIVASGTPNAMASTSTPVTNVTGRKYLDIVQDMVDWYSYCQYDGSPGNIYGGGWRYNCQDFPDNSAAQWGAIGLLGAQYFGATVPQMVKDWNRVWLKYSQAAPNAPLYTNGLGYFGYTSTSPAWGPYAVTPSGMVQMTMDGIGRGSSPAAGPSWEGAETFLRENWDTTASGATNNIKDYYYGLFSFTKSMLLHDPDGNGVPDSIACLQSFKSGTTKKPIDWYGADKTRGTIDPCSGEVPSSDGVARTIVGDQNAAGYWYGNNYSYSYLYTYETAQAIMMLNRTVFESGLPVAVAVATPNPAVVGATVTLNGAGSFHQDSSRVVDSWQWDLDNDGTYDVTGPVVAASFPALGNYPVTLRVTDDGAPEKAATTTVVVQVSIPPLAPTADAGGPYSFCPGRTPWFVDGTGSVNPDEGQSEAGQPGDTIQSYLWDLDGDGQFDDASGSQPDVTSFMQGLGTGSYLIQLKVTDTTGTSYPSSPAGDLSDTDSAQVTVRDATDPACACISNLAARAKLNKIQLTWSPQAGVAGYNVYRSTVSGGPYLKIGSTTSSYSTYLDSTVVAGTRYYYVVRPTAANTNELCQSNQSSALPTTRTR